MRRPRKSMNQINVVPYIDVMLVLLVIFMVTAPLVNPGEIELPSVGSKLTAPSAPLELTLRSDGRWWLEDKQLGGPPLAVSKDELVQRIREKQAKVPGTARRHRSGQERALRGRDRRARPPAAQWSAEGRAPRPADRQLDAAWSWTARASPLAFPVNGPRWRSRSPSMSSSSRCSCFRCGGRTASRSP